MSVRNYERLSEKETYRFALALPPLEIVERYVHILISEKEEHKRPDSLWCIQVWIIFNHRGDGFLSSRRNSISPGMKTARDLRLIQ